MNSKHTISSHWLFFIFFHLTILKFLPGSMGNRAAGGVVFIAVFLLVCRKAVPYRQQAKEYAKAHRLECLAGLLALLLLLASCLVNFDWQQKYQWPMSAILMLSALASYTFLILSYWLFRLSRRGSGYEFVLFVFLLSHTIAIWEFFHFSSVRPILENTLRSGNLNPALIASFFEGSTVYGPWAAVSGIFFLQRVLADTSTPIRRWLEMGCAVGGFAGALLSGSRSGLLAMGVGLFIIFFQVDIKNKIRIAGIGLIAVIALHWIASYHPYVARKAGNILPYIKKLHTKEKIIVQDFVPQFDARAMSGRPRVWAKAMELYKTSPWIGIGLGQYNIRSGKSWKVNVNNIYLNFLVECGVFVFLIFLYVFLKFVRHRRGTQIFAVLVALAVIGVFDNQYDHSLPWNLTIAWMLANGDNGAAFPEKIA